MPGNFQGLDEAARRAALTAYRRLNDSPMQQRLRDEAPCWVGAVYWNPQEESYEAIRDELRRIRETGFTFVRFHCIDPKRLAPGEWDFRYPDMRLDAAAEVGLKAFPHLRTHRPGPVELDEAGLTEDEAVGMIVRGFLDVGIKGIPEELRDEIEDTITQTALGM